MADVHKDPAATAAPGDRGRMGVHLHHLAARARQQHPAVFRRQRRAEWHLDLRDSGNYTTIAALSVFLIVLLVVLVSILQRLGGRTVREA